MRREEARQGDGEDDTGPVGEDAGRRQRARLEQPRPHRLEARTRLGVEHELRSEVGADRIGRERHRRRDGLDDDLGRRRLPRLGAGHPCDLAAVSFSMPTWSISGSISRCNS